MGESAKSLPAAATSRHPGIMFAIAWAFNGGPSWVGAHHSPSREDGGGRRETRLGEWDPPQPYCASERGERRVTGRMNWSALRGRTEAEV